MIHRSRRKSVPSSLRFQVPALIVPHIADRRTEHTCGFIACQPAVTPFCLRRQGDLWHDAKRVLSVIPVYGSPQILKPASSGLV